MRIIWIGIDDTDSVKGGCTTYLACVLIDKLTSKNIDIIGHPKLVRLNPNIPWKTRGNGALCLRTLINENMKEKIKETVISTVEENSDLDCEGTEPGIVFFEAANVPREVKFFARNAITGIVNLRDALKLLKKFSAEAVGFKKGRGIIGGLAAIGETLTQDHTYEIIAYRVPENYGLKRRVDEESIFVMDEKTASYTFNNVDLEKKRIIVTPRGADPILFGIRGESPEVVKKAFAMVKSLEPIERWVVFRTNQGTDAHLKQVGTLNQIKPYSSVVAKGKISSNPRIIPRRHVIFSISDETGVVDCAAFEPTGVLRKITQKLVVGDLVEVHGGVKKRSGNEVLTINLEKIRLLELAPKIMYQNPICPTCNKRLKSMGKEQGYRCEKCGVKYPDLLKVEVKSERGITKGLYITSTRSQRHLTKPFRRYGLEKKQKGAVKFVDVWHFP